jgi:hypothetical protein
MTSLLGSSVILSMVEAISQKSLKSSSINENMKITSTLFFIGFIGYSSIPIILYLIYKSGQDLSKIQLYWSIISSFFAIISGYIFFDEDVLKLLPPLIFLILAQVFMP